MSNITTPSWLPWALLSAIFAALTAICAKIGVQAIDSDLATFIRTLFISLILGAILSVSGKFGGFNTITPRSWTFLLLSGIATGASWLCYFRALKLGEAARVAPIDKLSVVFVALLGVSLLGEQMSLRGWIGIAMIAGGSICVALS